MMIVKILIAICWVGVGILRAVSQFKMKDTPTNEEYWMLYMTLGCYIIGACGI